MTATGALTAVALLWVMIVNAQLVVIWLAVRKQRAEHEELSARMSRQRAEHAHLISRLADTANEGARYLGDHRDRIERLEQLAGYARAEGKN